MEACNFGHKKIVELLLAVPSLDLEAMNIRGQRADEVAGSRGILKVILSGNAKYTYLCIYLQFSKSAVCLQLHSNPVALYLGLVY